MLLRQRSAARRHCLLHGKPRAREYKRFDGDGSYLSSAPAIVELDTYDLMQLLEAVTERGTIDIAQVQGLPAKHHARGQAPSVDYGKPAPGLNGAVKHHRCLIGPHYLYRSYQNERRVSMAIKAEPSLA
jgi:hypothetical protein